MRQYISLVGLVLLVIADFAYLRDTLRGVTMPNRVTFFFWAFAPMVAFAAQVQQGVTWSSIATLAASLGPLLILIASFVSRHGNWQLRKLDYSCGVLALLSLVLWQVTGKGNIAIALSILTDLFASIPTMVKSYRAPHTETGWTYIPSSINGLTGLLSATAFTFAAIAFPLYLAIACGTIAVLAMVPRKAIPVT